MIYFLSGKPGGGKTYYLLRIIEQELMTGTRTVVTNIALKLPELREYLQKKYDKDVDLWARIRILTEDEVPAFYLHRQKGVDIQPVNVVDERRGCYPAIAENRPADDPGILYAIDEAHQFYNARAWQSNGLSIFHYLAKHRHFNDEIYFISQNPEQVDKQLKLQVQYWIYCLNTGNDLFGRGFRGKMNHIKASWFTEELPKKMNFVSRSMASKVEDIDIEITKPDGKVRLGDCYETLQFGGSNTGLKVEVKKKPQGRSVFWMAIPVAIVVVILFSAPKLLSKGLEKVVGGANEGLQTMHKQSPSGTNPQSVETEEQPKPLLIHGYYTFDGFVFVNFADGRGWQRYLFDQVLIKRDSITINKVDYPVAAYSAIPINSASNPSSIYRIGSVDYPPKILR